MNITSTDEEDLVAGSLHVSEVVLEGSAHIDGAAVDLLLDNVVLIDIF